MKKAFNKYIIYFLIIALLYFPLFGNLGQLPIQVWDEARTAINAFEMLSNHNYLVTYFDGEPDMWNTKPPLLIWLQVLSMKVFGVNELAIRLPSAIAGLLTALVLLFFAKKYLQDDLLGFVSALALVTFHKFVDLHATRTGDYDALLTLFTTLSGLAVFIYSETRKNLYLVLFFLLLALAVLTKSIQGLLFLPGILLFITLRKQLISLLRNKYVYLGSLLFIVLVAGYYLTREFQNTGYLKAVQENELLGRYTETIENHYVDFGYYFGILGIWNVFILGGFISGLRSTKDAIRNIAVFSFVMVISYLAIISISKTQLSWYIVPLFPFIALLTALLILYIFQFLSKIVTTNNEGSKKYIPYIALFVLAAYPYFSIVKKVYKPEESLKKYEFYEVTRYLKAAWEGSHDLNNQYLLYDGYSAHNDFYIHMLNEKDILIERKDWRELNESDVVIVGQEDLKEFIMANYIFDILSIEGNIETYIIHERKNQPGS